MQLLGKNYLTSTQVREQYQLSRVSLYRIERRPHSGFPKPVLFNGKRYYAEDEILDWVRAEIAKSTQPRKAA